MNEETNVSAASTATNGSYPLGYTPMTDEELIEASCDGDVNDTFVDCLRLIERAALARYKESRNG